MTYLGQLTSELRYKNYTTPEIVEILQDVQAHAAASGQAPEESFGDAAEYPRKSTLTPFKIIMNIAYAVMFLGWAVAFFVLRLAFGAESMPRPWLIGLLTLVGLVLVGLIGWAYSRRVPRLTR